MLMNFSIEFQKEIKNSIFPPHIQCWYYFEDLVKKYMVVWTILICMDRMIGGATEVDYEMIVML